MKTRLALAALALGLAATGPARAEIPNMSAYGGLSLGGNLVLSGWDVNELEGTQWTSPGSGPLLKVRGGFQPFRWISGEVGLGLGLAPAGDVNAILQYELDVLVQPFDFDKLTPFLDVGVGAYNNLTPDYGGPDGDPQFHWGLGARYMLFDWLALRGEVRHVITDGLAGGVNHNLELSVGADYFFWKEKKEPTPDDKDGDGIADAADRCPDEAGPAKRQGCPFKDQDGDGVADEDDACPSTKGPESRKGCPEGDRDGDGIGDDTDKCPGQAGPAERDGCPPPDADRDGVTDDVDRCPTDPGPQALEGCPDGDGDGVADDRDKCPKEAGEAAWQGCKPPPAEVMKKFSGALQGIKFKTGSAVIDPSSAPVLNDAAKTLKAWPGVRVAIEGHTDDQGPDEKNLKLSEDRAESVRKYLIGKGVPAEQMEAKGYGETKPVADNKTAAGRAKNRRIEFNILAR